MSKWARNLVAVFAACGLSCGGISLAKDRSSAPAEHPVRLIAPGSHGSNANYIELASYQEAEESSPFEEEPEEAPVPGVLEPSGDESVPPMPTYESAPLPPPLDVEAHGPNHSDAFGSCLVSDCNVGSDCTETRHSCCCPSCCRSGVFSDITIGGWLAQGFTWNPDSPDDRFNGPVTFNDRANEYQLNQLWLFAEREADTGGYGLAFGGRVDFIYGTDHFFTTAAGLDDNWSNSERFYGPALPQVYVDAAFNDLTVRMGHFFTTIGYEVVPAPENFFYSHAYTMQYGEPFTHTGLLAMWKASDQVTITGGLHRGWDNWEDNNDNLGFLGGIAWTSRDEKTAMTFALTTSEEDDNAENTRTMYSLVLSRKITQRLQYVLQHDWGCEQAVLRRENGTWFGFNNYLFYEINRDWSVGVRYEWFSDDDGMRVGITRPSPSNNWQAVPANWQALTAGVHWTPRSNVTVRSEIRWDWMNPMDTQVLGVFDDSSQPDQFLWGTDLIITF